MRNILPRRDYSNREANEVRAAYGMPTVNTFPSTSFRSRAGLLLPPAPRQLLPDSSLAASLMLRVRISWRYASHDGERRRRHVFQLAGSEPSTHGFHRRPGLDKSDRHSENGYSRSTQWPRRHRTR
jgi:hypothetical protein